LIKDNIKNLIYLPHLIVEIIYFFVKNIKRKSGLRLWGLPVILNRGHIEIGKNFVAVSSHKHNSIGLIQPVVIKTLSKDATIIIGDDVGISGCTISAAGKIIIGNEVLIGSGALITDSDAHSIHPKGRRYIALPAPPQPVIIEDNVFIGARAIILKGVTIGIGSVIGAGSVVTRNIPPYSIASGNPARVIGDCRDA
jgi:acetyltransferase-like isoleucine patch superfamily enzyme